MSLVHPFEAKLVRAWPPDRWCDVNMLVAVSGGPDSVALLRGLIAVHRQGKGRLIVAHYNHQTRGPEADDDQTFVTQLCDRYQLPYETGRPLSGTHTRPSEVSLRKARYRFLVKTARRLGARYLATAHTADDQAETILHRLVRGTGLVGLAGIPKSRVIDEAVTVIRPLLGFSREEVRDYLRELGQDHRHDPSNWDRRYTRNRIRHELLPWLRDHYNPAVQNALLRLGQLAGEAQRVIAPQVESLTEQAVRSPSHSAATIDCRPLADEPDYLVRELLVALWRRQGWPLRAMGLPQWQQLAAMIADATADTPRVRMLPGKILAQRDQDRLTLTATLDRH
jgi:tRNA(Ile)-lysidine synthase